MHKKGVTLNFGNLPLVEAVVRVSLRNPVALSYTYVNKIADQLGKSFPVLTEANQVEVAPGITGQVQFGPGILPGAVYKSADHALLVSVQPQVIVARWLKRLGAPDRPYPRFRALCKALWDVTESFRLAVGDDFPESAVVNMSYVNFLPSADHREILKKYFSERAQLGAMRDAHEVLKLEASWSPRKQLDIRFALERATSLLTDEAEEGYRLTTAAGIRLSESLDEKSALESVHESLQEFFLELISEQAKKEWQLEVTND